MIVETSDEIFIRWLIPSRVDDMALIPGIIMALHSIGRTVKLETHYDCHGGIETIKLSSIPRVSRV